MRYAICRIQDDRREFAAFDSREHGIIWWPSIEHATTFESKKRLLEIFDHYYQKTQDSVYYVVQVEVHYTVESIIPV